MHLVCGRITRPESRERSNIDWPTPNERILVSDCPRLLIYLFIRAFNNPIRTRLMSTTEGCIPAPTVAVWRGCDVSVDIREVSVAVVWVRPGVSVASVVEEEAFRT
jgi:hypothetical protein